MYPCTCGPVFTFYGLVLHKTYARERESERMMVCKCVCNHQSMYRLGLQSFLLKLMFSHKWENTNSILYISFDAAICTSPNAFEVPRKWIYWVLKFRYSIHLDLQKSKSWIWFLEKILLIWKSPEFWRGKSPGFRKVESSGFRRDKSSGFWNGKSFRFRNENPVFFFNILFEWFFILWISIQQILRFPKQLWKHSKRRI